MGWLARFHIDLRWLALLLCSAVISALVLGLGFGVLSAFWGYRLPRDWPFVTAFFAAALTLRTVIPALLIWIAVVAIGRRLRWRLRNIAIVAASLIGVFAWLNLMYLAGELIGPRVLNDMLLLCLMIALPVIVVVGAVCARVIYGKERLVNVNMGAGQPSSSIEEI